MGIIYAERLRQSIDIYGLTDVSARGGRVRIFELRGRHQAALIEIQVRARRATRGSLLKACPRAACQEGAPV